MEFRHFRNKDKRLVKAFVKTGREMIKGKIVLDATTCLSEPVLHMMYLFAKMRDTASENDLGFAAYWISDNLGYLVTNIEGD